jgi:hypothetical protein
LSAIHFPISGASLIGYASGGSATEGTILKTADGGATWAPLTSGTTNWLFGIMFFDLNLGWAVGFNGTILKTANGGTTWTPQASGTTNRLLAVHFVSPELGWAVGYAGTIIRTNDGGATWQAQESGVTTNLWGVHFLDAQTGWAAGWTGTIVHTTNGGTTFVESFDRRPDEFALHQNYPNPFNPTTHISYEVPTLGFVSLKVFDLLGKEVATLVAEAKQPGRYSVQFDATTVPSGAYVYRLTAGSFAESKRMMVLR